MSDRRPPMAGGFRLTEADLPPLAIGAALLGTGGGGNPYIGMLRTRELMRRGATVDVVPLDALDDDALVCSVGGIGAPVVGVEKIEEGEECLRALRALEETAGRDAAALIAAEIGGANSMEPMLTAAQAGIPVLDADGMGRAFPEVQMTTFFIYGCPSAPAAIADDKGNCVVFKDVVDMYWLERFARTIAVDMGAGAGFATPLMRADFLKRYAIPDTVSYALRLGRVVLDARTARRDVIASVAEASAGKVVFAGKVTDVRRELKGGFAVGEANLAGLSDWSGEVARIAIQNENLVLWRDGEVAVSVPDLIVNLELDSGEPITTEMLRYGQRLAVLALPAPDLLKTPEALAVVGPRAFGYPEITYRPLGTA